MGDPAHSPQTSRVCKSCQRELPLTTDYFRQTLWSGVPGWRNVCRNCNNKKQRAALYALRDSGKEAQAANPAKFVPQIVGEGGPEGGYTEHPDDGYRFVCLPDSHGDLIDWPAAEAALAFIRFYKPVRVFLLGDHVDFAAFSRFDKPPSDISRISDDVGACRKFLKLVRESAPQARISYRKGNHEHRFQKHLWKHQELAKTLELEGMDLPHVLRLEEQRIEWVESGTEVVNASLIIKHGHMVRMRSGYTGTGELERNGISGVSGHTHRLAQIYKRSRVGLMTWVESGCLCKYDPEYMEGQVSDWQQGISFGTVALRGGGFNVHTAPIIKGKVKALGKEIGP